MKRFPVQVWGPAYLDRSRQFSSQSCINLFPSRPAEGRSIRAAHEWPGAKLFSAGAGQNRGMGTFNGVLYKVNGQTLYSVSDGGIQTSIGSIGDNTRCHLEEGQNFLIISTGSERYQYDGTTLSRITDVDHEGGNTAAYINRQMVYDGDGGSFWVAGVGDPDSINALDTATAESQPGTSMAVHAFRNTLRVFTDVSVEPWFNDGSTSNPPFSRIDSAVRPTGLSSPYAIAADDTYVYFLSADRQIYRTVDIDLQRITPVQMESFLEGAAIGNVIAECVSMASQYFLILTFPTDGKTWVLPTNDPESCFQISTGVNRDRHLMDSYCYCYGKHLIADYRNGDVSEWDFGTYQDSGHPRLRERALAPINGEALGAPGAEITTNGLEYIMEVGSGKGSVVDPVVQLDISFDGGRSWTNEKWVKIGKAGEKIKVRHNVVRTFVDAIPRFRCTEDVPISLHSAAIFAKFASRSR